MSINSRNKKIIGDILIFIFLSIVIFLYMDKSGVLQSGYHLIDDHEIIFLRNQIETQGFFRPCGAALRVIWFCASAPHIGLLKSYKLHCLEQIFICGMYVML